MNYDFMSFGQGTYYVSYILYPMNVLLEHNSIPLSTAVSSEAWAKLRVWASVAGRGRLLLSGSAAHASLETTVG